MVISIANCGFTICKHRQTQSTDVSYRLQAALGAMKGTASQRRRENLGNVYANVIHTYNHIHIYNYIYIYILMIPRLLHLLSTFTNFTTNVRGDFEGLSLDILSLVV